MVHVKRHLSHVTLLIVVIHQIGGVHFDVHKKKPLSTAGKTKHHGHKRHTFPPLRYEVTKPDTNSPIRIQYFRKTSDQFKWPWKNYEDWKQQQEKLENEIDAILKMGRKKHPVPQKHNVKQKKTIPKRKVNRKKRNKRKSKNKKTRNIPEALSHLKNSSITDFESVDQLRSSGGRILSVKYYSTADDSN